VELHRARGGALVQRRSFFFTGEGDGAEILRRRRWSGDFAVLLYLRVEAGRAKERAVFFARPVNDPLLYFLVVEIEKRRDRDVCVQRFTESLENFCKILRTIHALN
jgi:hypothetical protein